MFAATFLGKNLLPPLTSNTGFWYSDDREGKTDSLPALVRSACGSLQIDAPQFSVRQKVLLSTIVDIFSVPFLIRFSDGKTSGLLFQWPSPTAHWAAFTFSGVRMTEK